MNGYQIKKLLTIIQVMGYELPLMPKRYPDIDKDDKENIDFCELFIDSSKLITLAAVDMFPIVKKEVDERFK